MKQDAWQNDRIRVIVSTNAFGMGIDKPEVRFVVHMDLPDSPEAYFQEAGRGGRDGKLAYAILLYNDSDRVKIEKRIASTFPEVTEIKDAIRHYVLFSVYPWGRQGRGLRFQHHGFCLCLQATMCRLTTR